MTERRKKRSYSKKEQQLQFHNLSDVIRWENFLIQKKQFFKNALKEILILKEVFFKEN